MNITPVPLAFLVLFKKMLSFCPFFPPIPTNCFAKFVSCSIFSWAAWIHLSITFHTTLLSPSPGPHSHSLLSLTSVVAFCPLLILQLGLSTCFVRKLPSAHYRNLPDSLSLDVLSQQTLGQFIYLTTTKSQPSTRELQIGYRPTDSKANALAFWFMMFLHSRVLWKGGQQNIKVFQLFIPFTDFYFSFSRWKIPITVK